MRLFMLSIAAAAAAAGIALAATGTRAQITYIPAAQVSAAFAKGAVLLNKGSYQVHASRREAPGEVEIHVKDTDIIYVLEGSTTFVTGGTVVDGKTMAPDEIRGTAVDDGETRHLGKGDVIIVPHGTPHWFKEVEGPVLYYVVKVR
jgi:quercetin dioxygenase-like cupin family protein